ncbi:MAG: xylulokinase [Acidimicrobiales bacterium]
MGWVVGVDSSTSACKVQVRDLDTGRVRAEGHAPHSPTTPPRSEQDPRAWEVALRRACAQAGVPDMHPPETIAIGAQQHGLVVVDPAGKPLRPAKLWNDTESAPDATALLDALPEGARGWAAACGSVPLPAFTITKLRWLHRCEPTTFRAIDGVLLPHDWLTSRLTGSWTTDRGDASGTGYWSPAESRYRFDLLQLVDTETDWPALVPEVLAPRAVAGEWRQTGATVAPGTGDNMAAALGLGLRPGDLALSFGTSATAFTVTAAPAEDPTGTVAGFADATGRFLPLVCTMNATRVTDAVARLLGVDRPRFDQLALQGGAGAGGLVLVPYLDGERTPNRPDARGSLYGLRDDVTAAQLARAAVEGVVCNLLAGADALGPRPPGGRVYLIGGGAQSAAYRRVVADLIGFPVVVPDDDQLVAAGAALQAATVHLGCGFAEVAESWGVGKGQVIEPDSSVDRMEIRARYAELAAREESRVPSR